jgi:uncharacterized protein (DUF697 family)
MNQPFLLHIVERVERFVGKLPATIQKPVLHELTPLKELFLQHRAPRFVLTGSNKSPLQELLPVLFGAPRSDESHNVLMEVFHWQKIDIGGHGTIELLDARGADDKALPKAEQELASRPADVFLHLADCDSSRPPSERELQNLSRLHSGSGSSGMEPKIVGINLERPRRRSAGSDHASGSGNSGALRLRDSLQAASGAGKNLLHVFEIRTEAEDAAGARQFLALLARELPNDVRVEIVRISRDRASQAEIAQLLVKSTAAICTAVGAQPIPLADLPILTTLQLVMVSGIMYISGRERSLRAATEFVGALGVNVGAGMVLREGARAVLKFFPGWGNVVCGMVAGAGTYAIGKAATVYFIEGVSLNEARRTYLASRKRRSRPAIQPANDRQPDQISSR